MFPPKKAFKEVPKPKNQARKKTGWRNKKEQKTNKAGRLKRLGRGGIV